MLARCAPISNGRRRKSRKCPLQCLYLRLLKSRHLAFFASAEIFRKDGSYAINEGKEADGD